MGYGLLFSNENEETAATFSDREQSYTHNVYRRSSPFMKYKTRSQSKLPFVCTFVGVERESRQQLDGDMRGLLGY